jgi:hypothetical protein
VGAFFVHCQRTAAGSLCETREQPAKNDHKTIVLREIAGCGEGGSLAWTCTRGKGRRWPGREVVGTVILAVYSWLKITPLPDVTRGIRVLLCLAVAKLHLDGGVQMNVIFAL